MDNKVIQRIDGALKQIEGIKDAIAGVSFDEFISTNKIMDVVSFRLIQLGERMIKLEQLLREKYPDLPWSKARTMRNIIVHDYEMANPKIIYDTATKDMDVLKKCFLKIKDDIKHISENSLLTNRLLLRPWDEMDANELYELAKEPEIGFWCGWEPHKDIRDSLFALHNFLEVKDTYAICLKETGSIVGSIGLSFDSKLINNPNECELGFWIGKPYQRNGFAFEASEEIIRHAFDDLGIELIWCSHYEDNIKSRGLQKKLGFSFCYISDKEEASKTEIGRKRCVNSLSKEKWKSNYKSK